MRMLDLIAKKKSGGNHSPQELQFIAQSAAEGRVPDYQLSAWLMAVRLRGMSEVETVALTRAMADSGPRLNLAGLPNSKIDKHSTGGVGDGISIALAPLVASAGVIVPMMSGRGLGHTGGTLDKLESIPGFKVRLKSSEVEAQLRSIGVCLFGQSEEIAPSDRKLYSLRDATSTVDSLPLIVASILSKKMTEDLNGLVLDVKSGSGAIFKDSHSAVKLGQALVKTSRKLGLRCVGIVSAMDQPLGLAVGNALEVKQAILALRGDRQSPDYADLLLGLGGWMLQLAGLARRWEDGAEKLRILIDNGQALDKFRKIIEAQGGDARVVSEPDRYLPQAAHSLAISAPRAGFIGRLDARIIGSAAIALGAGRDRMEDVIDPAAGIWFSKKVGDRLERGEEIARLYSGDLNRLKDAEPIFLSALAIAGKKPKAAPLIRRILR